MIADGVKPVNTSQIKGSTNVTLVFSAGQALLAAKAGATYVSPFIGRLDDISTDGLHLIAEIRQIYDNYGFQTEILQRLYVIPCVIDCAKIGADVMWSFKSHRRTAKTSTQTWSCKVFSRLQKKETNPITHTIKSMCSRIFF